MDSKYRKSSGEELKMLQGFLLEDAKYEIKSVRQENAVAFVMMFVAFAVTISLSKYLQPVIAAKDIVGLLIIGTMACGIWYATIRCMLTLIRNMKSNWAKKYYETIVDNEFRVQNVTIVEARHLHRLRNNLGGTVVKIKDVNGVLFDKEYVFKYWDNYSLGNALLIEIPLGDGDVKQIVFPCKQESQSTWDKGIKFYNKYVK